MLDRPYDQVDQVLDVVGVAAADPSEATGQRHHQRVDLSLDVRFRQALGLQAERQGGCGLSLGEPVDLVVEEDVGHVEVAAAGVDEVTGADAETVTVATNADNSEFRVRQLDAGSERQEAAVQSVHAVGWEVVRRFAGAANAADDGDTVRQQAEFGQRLLQRAEDSEVTTSRTPVVGVGDLEVLGRDPGFLRLGGHFPSPRSAVAPKRGVPAGYSILLVGVAQNDA